MDKRSISAQLTGRSLGAVHWLDGVLRDRAYTTSSTEAGGYWVSRCGISGHFTPVLHRQIKPAPWCKRCKAMSKRDNQFSPQGDLLAEERVPYLHKVLKTVTNGHVHKLRS